MRIVRGRLLGLPRIACQRLSTDENITVMKYHVCVILILMEILFICYYYINSCIVHLWRANTMIISYNKMWKLLIDKNMKRKDLKEKAEVSQNVMARLSKNQAVTMDTMGKICKVLQCDIGDVMEFIPEEDA